MRRLAFVAFACFALDASAGEPVQNGVVVSAFEKPNLIVIDTASEVVRLDATKAGSLTRPEGN